jgi:hypothetical protein
MAGAGCEKDAPMQVLTGKYLRYGQGAGVAVKMQRASVVCEAPVIFH